MKRLLFLSFALGVVAQGSELRVAIAQGTGIRTATLAPGGKYSVQCPNTDGGAGERVYYRPGCPTRADAGVTCVIDAGVGDTIMDFTAATGSQDPYKIDLAPNEDRLHFRNVDDAARVVWCSVARRSP